MISLLFFFFEKYGGILISAFIGLLLFAIIRRVIKFLTTGIDVRTIVRSYGSDNLNAIGHRLQQLPVSVSFGVYSEMIDEKKDREFLYSLNRYINGYEDSVCKIVAVKLYEQNFLDSKFRVKKSKYTNKTIPIIKEIVDNATISVFSRIIEEQEQIIKRRKREGYSVSEFFALRKQTKIDWTGVYVIYNCTRNMYYVGQAKKIFDRVNNHFTGHGNGDVYADYKRGGDEFRIQLLKLTESGYDSLDEFEKAKIAEYKADTLGYNKTKGNDATISHTDIIDTTNDSISSDDVFTNKLDDSDDILSFFNTTRTIATPTTIK